TLNVSVCRGASYDYNGTLVQEGTSQDFTLQNYVGCDSILTVNVGALPVSTGTVNVSVCRGASYDYNGTLVQEGTSQDFTLQNYVGCDSILTVNVGALPVSTGTLNVSVCRGASYDYNGTLVQEGTSQQFTLQNYLGCDSIVTVNVAALPTPTGTVQAAVCPGQTFNYHGAALQVGETRLFTLQSGIGCDSLVTVTVGALPTSTGSFTAKICPDETFTYNGVVLQAGQTQDFILQNYLGCDSVVTVTVEALPIPTGAVQAAVCPGESFNYHGVALQIGETRLFTLQSGIGCDSLVTVTVSGLPSSSETLAVTICPNETYLFAGDTLLPGEPRDFHFVNQEGCDSTITVSVLGFPAANFDLSAAASCAGVNTGMISVLSPSGGQPPYRYSLDGTSFQDETDFQDLAPGDYTVWLEDSNACFFQRDTTIPARLPLSLELADAQLPCDSSGVQLAPVVSGDPEGLSYQWSTGAQTPAIRVYDPGPVWVEVRNVCETLRRDISVDWEGISAGFSYAYVPNVFAPLSADPDNSRFRPYLAPELTVISYHFAVYDRWGNLMFRTQDTEDGWTGPFRQQDMQPAVFVWYLLADVAYCGRVRQIRREGDVTIVR
ncbi:MAG: hypothetical protein L6Q97_23970, partial [Thermoanaerobaculia bacterium]|nr:hypothetical protein [Thermoanaerobaculia bacterium]